MAPLVLRLPCGTKAFVNCSELALAFMTQRFPAPSRVCSPMPCSDQLLPAPRLREPSAAGSSRPVTSNLRKCLGGKTPGVSGSNDGHDSERGMKLIRLEGQLRSSDGHCAEESMESNNSAGLNDAVRNGPYVEEYLKSISHARPKGFWRQHDRL